MVNLKIPPEDLPFSFKGLESTYGKIRFGTVESSGVYFVIARKDETDFIGTDYYVVMPDAPAISQKARELGIPLLENPSIRLYCIDIFENQRYSIIEYEIHKYQAEHGDSSQEIDLREEEAIGMDECPEYFGECPVPTDTPWGPAIQYEKIANGLFWVETESAGRVLAVCYSLSLDMEFEVDSLSMLSNQDSFGYPGNDYGYHFFTEKNSCVALFELLKTGASEKRSWSPKIYMPALKNAILKFCPNYAEEYNQEWLRYAEKHGLLESGSGSGRINVDLIVPDPEAGIDFYHHIKS